MKIILKSVLVASVISGTAIAQNSPGPIVPAPSAALSAPAAGFFLDQSRWRTADLKSGVGGCQVKVSQPYVFTHWGNTDEKGGEVRFTKRVDIEFQTVMARLAVNSNGQAGQAGESQGSVSKSTIMTLDLDDHRMISPRPCEIKQQVMDSFQLWKTECEGSQADLPTYQSTIVVQNSEISFLRVRELVGNQVLISECGVFGESLLPLAYFDSYEVEFRERRSSFAIALQGARLRLDLYSQNQGYCSSRDCSGYAELKSIQTLEDGSTVEVVEFAGPVALFGRKLVIVSREIPDLQLVTDWALDQGPGQAIYFKVKADVVIDPEVELWAKLFGHEGPVSRQPSKTEPIDPVIFKRIKKN